MPQKKQQVKHKQTPVILIAAIQSDRGIGYRGGLLHRIKEDMEHFVSTTRGHTVIMGRKTWESIPEKFRPFKDRVNIVVTRDTSYKAPGATVVHRFYEALEQAPHDKKIFIIGGGELYKHALSYADTLDLTIVHGSKEADVFFPSFDEGFKEESKSKRYHDTVSDLDYEFVQYVRK